MPAHETPHLLDLRFRGFLRGVRVACPRTGRPLGTRYGGVPYALPPTATFRWRAPRALAPCYGYGTRHAPGDAGRGCTPCPQVGMEAGEEDGEGEGGWSEDCLQCNVWVPEGEAPAGGWPVLVYIHGGFLQFGDANAYDPGPLTSETELQCIVVKPGYRLNLFGFLSLERGGERAGTHGDIASNFGLWDQRLALTWTYKNINYFGGDPSNITLAGYSAGAYSAFHQLAYDLWQPQQIIRRCIMWSNGPGVQPKSIEEGRRQLDEVLTALEIPHDLDLDEKIQRLRATPASELLKVSRQVRHHQYRPVTDGRFVRHDLFASIDSGEFARRMRRAGVTIMIGECAREHHVYGAYLPPADSFAGLRDRLDADFPGHTDRILAHYFPVAGRRGPAPWTDWCAAFGAIYADLQVHLLQRGFIARIARTAPETLLRYRVEWRAGCADRFPAAWGATHTTDLAIWFWGEGKLTEEERRVVRKAFVRQLAQFVQGRRVEWGTRSPREVRRLQADGTVDVWEDDLWDRGVELWDVVTREDASLKVSANL